MRFLEIVLLLLAAFLPFLISFKKVNSNNKFILILIIGALALHSLFEGLRWQMSPIYIINFILAGCLLKRYVFFKGHWLRKIASGLFLFIMVGIGFALSYILPVFDLPTPTGSYQVGAQSIHFSSDIDETITDEIGDKRELMIKIWYPATIKNEAQEAYFDKGERAGFASKYGLPESTFNYLDQVKTNTFVSPAISDGKFPILIFSHGYYSNATGYAALIEEVVSQGYIVLNINHTYESMGSLFPSGQIKLYDSEYDKQKNNQEMAEMIWNTMENFKKAANIEEKTKAVEDALKDYFAAEITHRWANDISLVVNQIPQWNASTFLSNHIDTTKIGVFGHSQGGAAAGQALLENPKISAGMNIDGTQWGEMVDTFFTKPFLLLSSDFPESHPDLNEIAFQNQSTSDFYLGKIKETGHASFMDIPFMINLSLINEAGNIDPKETIHITSKVVTSFFDKYLNSKKVDLLELSKSNSALEIEKRSRD
jgi:predicted dienelactone hydrolase